ncbi:MAG: Gfo/Idh/MocA family oxidoreductase, partial [Pseudomonadota bacterium]
VIGYTQRFRRRWLVAKEKVRTGALGEVTMVTSRAFMNRLVAIDNYQRSDNPSEISPMVISGTHALDIVMWLMETKTPAEVYARSVNKALGPKWQGIDGTGYTISFDDGAIYHGVISWALPEVWPGAVYSLEVGAVGTEGVLTIDDTHRDIVLATNLVQGEGYAPTRTATWTFLPATRWATWRSANCADRCARKPTRGSIASRWVCRPSTLPHAKDIIDSCLPRPSTFRRGSNDRFRCRSRPKMKNARTELIPGTHTLSRKSIGS